MNITIDNNSTTASEGAMDVVGKKNTSYSYTPQPTSGFDPSIEHTVLLQREFEESPNSTLNWGLLSYT